MKFRTETNERAGKRYEQIADQLRSAIVSGNWMVGHALPSEQQLAQDHQVAVGTIRQAVALLVEQGLVERVHGRGTFVRGVISGAGMLRFFRFGSQPDVLPRSFILSVKIQPASEKAAAALQIAPGSQTLYVMRLRQIQERPCLLEDIVLPLPRFQALGHADPSQWGDFLYPAYERLCAVHVQHVTDTITFNRLTGAQAKRLELAKDHPCAKVERIAYDRLHTPVEWRVTRGDAYAFRYTNSIL
jgi:GntR family transcriptional regulator